MAPQREDMNVIVYSPALTSGDSRPVSIVHALEQALPGVQLRWTVAEDHQLIALPQRDVWIAEPQGDGGFRFVCNNDEAFPVTLSGPPLPASSGPGGQALLEVHAQVPLDARGILVASEVLEALAKASRAFWGHATPFRAALDIARQTKNGAANPRPPPRGLPALQLPRALSSPEIPHRLGWLNYWSAEAARAIGFPDQARDTGLLPRARQTAQGGWVVQLTAAPLDLDAPTHLETLLRMYERFPEIGRRTTPRSTG